MTTTTTTTTGPSVYELLERLPNVAPDPAITTMLDRVYEVIDQVTPIMLEARTLLEEHERATSTIVDETIERFGLDLSAEDALYQLMSYPSGAYGLHNLLCKLRDTADADRRLEGQ